MKEDVRQDAVDAGHDVHVLYKLDGTKGSVHFAQNLFCVLWIEIGTNFIII